MESPSRPLRILFVTVFLDLLGFGLILPQLPYYAKACGADGTVVGAIGASYSLLQFLFSPIWGRVSDSIGRRPIIVMGLLGSGVSFILFGAVFHVHRWTGIGLIPIMFLSRALAGMFNANISTAQAYVADVLPPEKRAAGMGMIGAAFGLGFVLGPAFSAALGVLGGPALPFYVAGGVGMATAVAAFFWLPESHLPGAPGQEPRRRWLSLSVIPSGALLVTIALFFLSTFAMGIMENTLGLFVEAEPRFGYTPHQFALLLVFVGVVIVITQGGLVRWLSPRFGEPRMILVGAILMVMGLGGIGVARGTLELYLLMALVGFGNGILNPSLSTTTSLLAPHQYRGEVMGMGQSMSSLGRILGPLLGGAVYEHVGHASAYYLSGATMIVASALAVTLLGIERTAEAGGKLRGPDAPE
ncbi:MAG: MFS transporter [Candidatus Wallbacteria bacterium]|nr:MFS transporter [Candidatus Wallbacteria bacterium]